MKEDDITKRQKSILYKRNRNQTIMNLYNFTRNQKLNLKLLQDYPNSFFMDVRCNGCLYVTTIHSHPQELVPCPSCFTNLCYPSNNAGGPGTLDDCTFWRKTTKPFNGYVLDETLPTN